MTDTEKLRELKRIIGHISRIGTRMTAHEATKSFIEKLEAAGLEVKKSKHTLDSRSTTI